MGRGVQPNRALFPLLVGLIPIQRRPALWDDYQSSRAGAQAAFPRTPGEPVPRPDWKRNLEQAPGAYSGGKRKRWKRSALLRWKKDRQYPRKKPPHGRAI